MKYYVYRTNSNTFFTLDSFNSLLDWVSSHNYRNHQDFLSNSLFDELALNDNDTVSHLEFKGYYLEDGNYQSVRKYEKSKRTLFICDELFRTIDIRWYKDELIKHSFQYSKKRKNYSRYKKWETFEFRKDPVPKTGRKYALRNYRYYRKVSCFQEIKKSSNPEHTPYIRGNRKPKTLDVWNEEKKYSKQPIHSWKRKKIKKQWAKNL